jgi:L-ascorbate metabolism protein UlaG (beta-lactamase superfamily)
MQIKFLGHASFQIKGQDVTIITDPFDPQAVGFSFPKVEASIVTVSHQHEDHNFVEGVAGDPYVIDTPGEFEIKGVSIFGIQSDHDAKGGSVRGRSTIYLFEFEDLAVVHLGDLGRKLKPKEADALRHIDILMIPVGGTYTINAEQAAEIAAELEPSIIIPMHYQTDDLKLGKKLDPVSKFIEQMGVGESTTPQGSLKISRTSLPSDPEVVLLQKVR